MVDYIVGVNGIGKSKMLLEAAVSTARISKGNVIFVDYGNKLEKVLPSNIRLINIEEYSINSTIALCGFLVGLCAGDYDITDIFIDSTLKIIPNQEKNIDDFFKLFAELTKDIHVNFHFSLCDKFEPEIVYQNC